MMMELGSSVSYDVCSWVDFVEGEKGPGVDWLRDGYDLLKLERYREWEEETLRRAPRLLEDVKEDGFLSSGLTSDRLLEHRTLAMMYYLGKHNCVNFEGFAYGLDDIIGEQTSQWLRWCQLQGILVPAEERYYLNRYGGSIWDLESVGLAIEFEDDVYWEKRFNPRPRVLELDEALGVFGKQRERGKRVVVTLGSFDIGTRGQAVVLDNLRWMTQEFGVNVVLVGDDHGVGVGKGPGRPYVHLDRRIMWLAGQGVDYIVPVRSTDNEDVERLSEHYDRLHQRLAGIVHIRLVGDLEPDWADVYLRQCLDNGILLVESGLPRISQARDSKGKEAFRRVRRI